jgi:hypothetical protein
VYGELEKEKILDVFEESLGLVEDILRSQRTSFSWEWSNWPICFSYHIESTTLHAAV